MDCIEKYLRDNGAITGKANKRDFKKYYFDLDDTVADTSELRMHRKTEEGKKYISENIKKFNIGYYPDLTKLINKLNEKEKVSIITNISEEYARAVLDRGGFSKSIPIHCELKKPCQDLFSKKVLSKQAISDGIVIGNSPIDILTAHGYEEDFAGYDWPISHHLPSAGILWGRYKDDGQRLRNAERIQKAEPSRMLMEISQLEGLMEDFEKGNMGYKLRKDPHRHDCVKKEEFYPSLMRKYSEGITYRHLGYFHPKEKGKRMDDFSQRILRFKDSRNFQLDEIKNNLKDEFFYKGAEKQGLISFDTYKDNFYRLIYMAKEKIGALSLNGKSIVVASPGSSPEYCNESDINHLFARRLNKDIFNIPDSKRFVSRIFPKIRHMKGTEIHLKTIGIRKNDKLPEVSNIIIFDDVYTGGSQTNALAYLLREKAGFNGNLYCLTLGKTDR